MKLLIVAACLLLISAPAFASDGFTMPRGSIALVFHVAMNGIVLWKIWSHKTVGRGWQVAWSLISLLVFVVGPFLFFAFSQMPPPMPREERATGSNLVSFLGVSMGFGGAGAEGIPPVARFINGELEPDETAPHSKLAAEARLAAKHGGAKAQTHYATLLEYGDGTAQDFKGAARWYRRAADQGYAPAQAHLADLYARGLGVEKSAEEAFFWLSLAAKGDPHYASTRDASAVSLTHERQAAVAQRVQDWRAASVVTPLKAPA